MNSDPEDSALAAPTDLSAVGISKGVNRIQFRGNNPEGTIYEIWRLHGDTAPFALHATSQLQIYEDSPVTPGQYYEYKVRATSANAVSDFSNSAVVYGSI